MVEVGESWRRRKRKRRRRRRDFGAKSGRKLGGGRRSRIDESKVWKGRFVGNSRNFDREICQYLC